MLVIAADDALDAGVVPVYLGAPDVEGAVPQNSTINAHAVAPKAYATLQTDGRGSSSGPVEVMAKALAERLMAMDADPDELAKVHEWRKEFPTREKCSVDDRCMGKLAFTEETSNCRLCGAVYGAVKSKGGAGGGGGVVWNRERQRLEESVAGKGSG